MFRERPYPSRGTNPVFRPRLGDIVVYEMQKYKVVQCGMKYLHIKHETSGKLLSVKVQHVTKWFPTQNEPLLENMS